MKLNNYLHFYLGRECILVKSSNDYDVPSEGTRLTLTPQLLFQCLRDDMVPFLGVKPILRLLSTITEEELIELVRLKNDIFLNVRFVSIFYEDIIFEFEYKTSCRRRQGSINFSQLNSEMFTYLLGKGFDMFGLIEAELAFNEAEMLKEDDKQVG